MRTLYLGNNTIDTDQRVRDIAQAQNIACHGLVTDPAAGCYEHGIYHSSVYDLLPGDLVMLSRKFDRVIMLDQSREEYSHPDAFLLTVQITQKVQGQFLSPVLANDIQYWQTLIDTNKSFCILPWVEYMVRGDSMVLCCRSQPSISPILSANEFSTDDNFNSIRESMVNGKMLWDHCGYCYRQEQQGLLSARQQETVQWANRLGLKTTDDVSQIQQPVYYEMRASNNCNLKCRMCVPGDSHLIAKEYKQLGLITEVIKRHNNQFHQINLKSLQKLYIAGGEPMVMPEFIEFLNRCVQSNTTAFDLLINTNGTVMPRKFREIIDKFDRVHFIFSIDGIGAVNEYVRTNSIWNDVLDNWKWAYDSRHHVSVNTTVSVYNILYLDEIMKFIDQEFPHTQLHLQSAWVQGDIMAPDVYPDKQAISNVLRECQTTRCYQNNDQVKQWIDAFLHRIFAVPADQQRWNKFQEFNQQLDQRRNTDMQQILRKVKINTQLCPANNITKN